MLAFSLFAAVGPSIVAAAPSSPKLGDESLARTKGTDVNLPQRLAFSRADNPNLSGLPLLGGTSSSPLSGLIALVGGLGAGADQDTAPDALYSEVSKETPTDRPTVAATPVIPTATVPGGPAVPGAPTTPAVPGAPVAPLPPPAPTAPVVPVVPVEPSTDSNTSLEPTRTPRAPTAPTAPRAPTSTTSAPTLPTLAGTANTATTDTGDTVDKAEGATDAVNTA